MSLRELVIMAQARQEAEWARSGVIAAISAISFAGGRFDPMKFIPPAFRPKATVPRKKTAAELESESRIAWRCLDQFFGKKR